MLTITTKPGCELLLVELPIGAHNIGWRAGLLTCKLPESTVNGYHMLTAADNWLQKTGGQWEFVATTETVTEEQAAGLIDEWTEMGRFKCYKTPNQSSWFSRAIESLRSAITAAGGDIDKVYAILKKHAS